MSEPTPIKRRPGGLGRGLGALLGEMAREEPVAGAREASPGVRMLPVSALAPHPGQPRRHFDEAALDELAASIAARGVIQPIVVRPHGRDYQIVAGERRWRAAQRARLTEVPVVVREFDEATTLEIALIENIQRQDLNAIEEAQAYQRLLGEYGHTQDALARIVHKSRSHVANLLRLLELPDSVQAMVSSGVLSMGHARALVGAPDPEALAHAVVERGVTVREAERMAKVAKDPAPARPPRADRAAPLTPAGDADARALEEQLGDLLGLPVRVAFNDGAGSVTIGFATPDQLDMLCQRLTGEGI